FSFTRFPATPRTPTTVLFQRPPAVSSFRRAFASDSKPPNSSVTFASAQPTASTKDSRLKSLMKQYGYTALMIYLGVSAIDLTIIFLLLKQTGRDRIREIEDWLSSKLGSRYHRHEETEEDAQGREPSWATVLAIAYGIHKTALLPVR